RPSRACCAPRPRSIPARRAAFPRRRVRWPDRRHSRRPFMATFLVLIPPGARSGDEKARIVRDRFSWLALFLPVIWLLWHRAWLAAALAFAVQALGSAVADHPVFGLAGLGLCLATNL